jgi:H+/citrate symporter
MVQGISILIVFLFFAILMMRQKMSAALCMMGMAIIMALVSGVPLAGKKGILNFVFESGIMNFSSTMAALFFGAWLGEVMNLTGIARDIIRKASELAGDKPVVLAIVMSAVIGILFTSLQGFGATIAVGTIALPILTATGIKPKIAAAIFMIARTMGNLFNLTQWSLYIKIAAVSIAQIKSFAIYVSATMAAGLILFILIEMKLQEKRVVAWAVDATEKKFTNTNEKRVPLISLLTPIVPLILVMGLDWPITPALFVGVLYGVITTSYKNPIGVLTKSINEGVKSGIPALILLIGAGMLLATVSLPQVTDKLLPIVQLIIPANMVTYILFFALLAPLALYRGPMNLWGMGSGVMLLMIMAHTLPVMAICAGFFAAHVIQLSTDPTNSHNIWVSDYTGVGVNELALKMLPYVWGMAAVITVFGAIQYM